MKRYLLSIYQPAPEHPDPEALERIVRDLEVLNAELEAAGAWVFAGGLHAPSTATVVRSRDGEVVTTDGPFAEAKELVGGYAILEAPSLAEAKILASRVVDVHLEAGVADFDMEIRALSAPGGCGAPPQ
jgi:hypothetical protein